METIVPTTPTQEKNGLRMRLIKRSVTVWKEVQLRFLRRLYKNEDYLYKVLFDKKYRFDTY